LESSRGFWIVEILVRVVDSCKASVGALDLLISGCSLDLQRFIVVERCWRRHLANGWPPPNLNERKWKLSERRAVGKREKTEIRIFVRENERTNPEEKKRFGKKIWQGERRDRVSQK